MKRGPKDWAYMCGVLDLDDSTACDCQWWQKEPGEPPQLPPDRWQVSVSPDGIAWTWCVD